MTLLNRLASSLDRRDEVPNRELARALAAKKDKVGIREIAENLWNKDKRIQAACIKVLEKRLEDLSGSGLAWVRKVIKQSTNG